MISDDDKAELFQLMSELAERGRQNYIKRLIERAELIIPDDLPQLTVEDLQPRAKH